MPTNGFRCEIVDAVDGNPVCVRVYGELDMATAPEFREALLALAARNVVVDLSVLDFLDSSGITAILTARKEVVARGGTLVLDAANGIVRRVLEITGLSTLLRDGR